MMNSFPPQTIISQDQNLDLVYLPNLDSGPKPIIPKIADLTEKKSDKRKYMRSLAVKKAINSLEKAINSLELDDQTKKNLMDKCLELCKKPTNSSCPGRKQDWKNMAKAALDLGLSKDNAEKLMENYVRRGCHSKRLNPSNKVREKIAKNRILNAFDEKSPERTYKSNEAAWAGLTGVFGLTKEKFIEGKELAKIIDESTTIGISSRKQSIVGAILHHLGVPVCQSAKELAIAESTVRYSYKALFEKHEILKIRDLNSSH